MSGSIVGNIINFTSASIALCALALAVFVYIDQEDDSDDAENFIRSTKVLLKSECQVFQKDSKELVERSQQLYGEYNYFAVPRLSKPFQDHVLSNGVLFTDYDPFIGELFYWMSRASSLNFADIDGGDGGTVGTGRVDRYMASLNCMCRLVDVGVTHSSKNRDRYNELNQCKRAA